MKCSAQFDFPQYAVRADASLFRFVRRVVVKIIRRQACRSRVDDTDADELSAAPVIHIYRAGIKRFVSAVFRRAADAVHIDKRFFRFVKTFFRVGIVPLVIGAEKRNFFVGDEFVRFRCDRYAKVAVLFEHAPLRFRRLERIRRNPDRNTRFAIGTVGTVYIVSRPAETFVEYDVEQNLLTKSGIVFDTLLLFTVCQHRGRFFH